jgi:trans-aconitate methyltransferase
VSIIARQFGRPHGPLGRLIGRGMARSNAEFSRWVMQQVSEHYQGDPGRIAELGPGPGIGLQEALQRFGAASVWGVDLSPEMLLQSRKRNQADSRNGRLTLVRGDATALAGAAPLDLVVANHVLYFWHEPTDELTVIHGFLRPGGLLALGYQLRQSMPPMAQKHFPAQGHRLYSSDDEVAQLLGAAGFTTVTHIVKGPPEAPEGRATLATA